MAADPSEVSEGLYMTVEQYLALNEATDGKYEFLDGYVFMLRPPSSDFDDRAVDMAGGSIARAAICARMALLLGNALVDSPCTVYTSDARLQLAERQYLYPNLVVGCNEQSGTMLINPTVVIEALSPTAEERDRGAKFKTYKSLPSVQEYVLIGSEYRVIGVHRREGRFWKEQHYYEAIWLNSKASESVSPSTRCTTGYACSLSSNLAKGRDLALFLMSQADHRRYDLLLEKLCACFTRS